MKKNLKFDRSSAKHCWNPEDRMWWKLFQNDHIILLLCLVMSRDDVFQRAKVTGHCGVEQMTFELLAPVRNTEGNLFCLEIK